MRERMPSIHYTFLVKIFPLLIHLQYLPSTFKCIFIFWIYKYQKHYDSDGEGLLVCWSCMQNSFKHTLTLEWFPWCAVRAFYIWIFSICVVWKLWAWPTLFISLDKVCNLVDEWQNLLAIFVVVVVLAFYW